MDIEDLKEKIGQLSDEEKKEIGRKVKERMNQLDLAEILRKHLGGKSEGTEC